MLAVMKRVLVTGASGFIGCHVVRLLLREGIEVGAVVRPGSVAPRLADIRNNPHLQILEGDLTSAESVRSVLSSFAPEGVIHLAAAGVAAGRTRLADMVQVNVAGLARLLEEPALLGRRIVVAGSVFEYGVRGDEEDGDLDEGLTLSPTTAYGLSKVMATQLLERSVGVEWVLLRLFGVYGPWERPERLIPNLVSGLTGLSEVPLSDGLQVRDMTYVKDVAQAFVTALTAPKAAHQVINIGSGTGISVKDLALRAAALNGPEEVRARRERLLRFGARGRREGEPARLVAHTRRAHELLGWEARTTLDEGLVHCFEWFRTEPDNPWRSSTGRGVAFSIVIPCYNEEASLPASIPPLAEILALQGLSVEIVLVNNGSTDGTGRAIDQLIALGLPVMRVDVPRNEGYGFGILSGLRAAGGRCLGYMCADGQVAPEDVARLLWAVQRAGPEALVKVRRVARNDGLFRWLQSRIFNLVCLLLFRTLTTDINGTPKMAARQVWERMRLESRDWFIDAEVVVKAKRMGLSFVEIPVVFMPRQAGRSWVNWKTSLEFAKNIVRALARRW